MWARTFYGSTVGKKILLAVTGIIMVGFIVAHVLGNLLIFSGPEALRRYALLLRAEPALLWFARLVLLVAVVMHVVLAIQLTLRQRAARPVGYRRRETQAASIAARTMGWGGLAIGLFVIYHLLHMTTGTVHPNFVELDPFHNMVTGLGVWWVALIYLVAMGALALHLYHGTWSVFQTLGVNRPAINPTRRRLATLLTVFVAVGFVGIVLAVLFGVVRPEV